MSAEIQKLLNGPALTPPPGVIPNFVNPDNVFVGYVVTVVLCVSTSTLVFWMRMYTKIYILQQTGWEDYTALLGWLMYMGYCVPCTFVIYNGRGAHQWNVQLRTLIGALYYINIGSIMYGINITIIKISILLQYLKVFMPVRKTTVMILGSYMVIGITILFYFITTFFEIFACTPREKYWNRLIPYGHCFNINVITINTAIVNCISDFVILLLPQGVIWKLQMPLKRKFGISAIFLTGFFACVTSIIRLYYAVRALESSDITYNIAMMGLWTHAEVAVGIICSCLPVLPIFFQTIWPRIVFHIKTSLLELNGLKDFKRNRHRAKRVNDPSSASNSTGTLHRTYEIHGKYHSSGEKEPESTERDASTSSDVTSQTIGRLPISSGDTATDTIHMEDRRNNQQILKTVTIETVRETRQSLALDVENQQRAPW
ncbi:hypothetical protein MMC22_002710 [Lobaria immixta]|nr:hypothetical protein [Lobaria immixta]